MKETKKQVLLSHYIKRYGLVVSVSKEGSIEGIKYPRNGEYLKMTEIDPDHWQVKAENFVFSFTL